MAARSGRKFQLLKGTTLVAGLKEVGCAVAGEPIDITTFDDNGFRTLLSTDVGVQSIDLSVSGVTKDTVLRALAMAGGSSLMLTDITLKDASNNDTVTCNFFLSGFEETGAVDGALEFSATLQSSGAWTYTPGA
jgi:predicted secreted protein